MTAVAIVGLGGVFAGAPTLERFWDLILKGRDMSTDAPAERWGLNPADVHTPWPPAPDRVYAVRGCFISGFEPDTAGLDLEEELLQTLDSSCGLILHAGRQAFQSCAHHNLDRSSAGVILGQIALPTDAATALSLEVLGGKIREIRPELEFDPPDKRFAPQARRVVGLPAQLLARGLGLGGACYTLDAACASSFYAVKLACDELLSRRADLMLAGGMSRPDCLYTQMGFSQLRALSPSGRCAPFDAQGDGLLVGEGAGVVALKRLDDALDAGDDIWAVIRGWGLSNDVEGNLLAPAVEGQLRAMKPAYRMAGWKPWEVDLIECHATGTPVGDRIEFESLKALWADAPDREVKCTLGSVKSNVGHLLTGAGAAGLIKVLLAMKNSIRPPTANFSTPHPGLGLERSPFEVLTLARPWDDRPGPKRAAVSGFGFGGVNAHLLLEEWRDDSASRPRTAPIRTKALPEPVAVVGAAATIGSWPGLDEPASPWFSSDDREPFPRRGWWGERRGLPPGYYMDEVRVPIGRFRIPPSEIKDMLPQQALMLVVAADALEDAGYDPAGGFRSGGYIGLALDLNTTNYHLRWSLEKAAGQWRERNGFDPDDPTIPAFTRAAMGAAGPPLTAGRTLGALGSIVASRIAREFKMGGATHTVSSGATSGLHAVELAVRALRSKELDLVLAGAVDFCGDMRALRADQREGARGVPGEGAAAVVLKRLSDARADGDHVYAVIQGLGSAASQTRAPDGLKNAFYLAAQRACAEAAIEPAQVDVLEADINQYVGGPEDPAAFFQPYALAEPARTTLLNVAESAGRTGAAAGMCALVRAVLALDRKCLPSRPSAAPGYWIKNRQDGPRRAVAAAFGEDGGCAQVVLEECPDNPRPGPRVEVFENRCESGLLFTVAADHPDGLSDRALELQAFINSRPEQALQEDRQEWRAKTGETRGRPALALIPRSRDELTQLIDTAVAGMEFGVDRFQEDRIFFERTPLGPAGDLAFVFPGSGNHFPGMGSDLAAAWPEVFENQDRENNRLRDQFAADAFWFHDEEVNDLRQLICAQVAVGTAVHDVLTGCGLLPGAVMGHSLGETSALFATKTWNDRDEMLRRMWASTLFTRDLAGEFLAAREVAGVGPVAPFTWLSGVVGCLEASVRETLPEFPGVYLQIVNAPDECVIGGEARAVRSLADKLGCVLVPLPGVSAVHCAAIGPVRRAYRDLHLFDTRARDDVRIYSAAWSRAYRPDRLAAADSITDQASATMHFPRLVEQAHADGLRLFLEIGPGSSCTRMITKILNGRPHATRAVYTPNTDCRLSVMQALAWASAHGVEYGLQDEFAHAGPVVLSEPEQVREIPEIVIPTGRADFHLPEPPAPQKDKGIETAVEPPAPVPPGPGNLGAARSLEPLFRGLARARSVQAAAHERFLELSENITGTMAENLAFQLKLTELMASGRAPDLAAWSTPPPLAEPGPDPRPAPFLNRRQCLEFAVGRIGNVLGREFSEIDGFPTRVRLPDEPLMLVDRIVEVEDEPLSLKPGRVRTQHDVLHDGWYLDGGRIPTCIAIEAGQADLFLSAYLGIDFKTRGLALYRLLDAEVTFQGPLPGPGEVIDYDIRIERFFRHGDTHLFRFNFDATVNGRPLMIMREGCAGFFSPEELGSGRGLVQADLEFTPDPKSPVDEDVAFTPLTLTSLDEAQVEALYNGDPAGCFGPAYDIPRLKDPQTLPAGRMQLIDRVLHIDTRGGPYGRGSIKTEMDIHPDDWFLTCHFVDDMVMPGTLMYECCLHSLRIFLLGLGWIGEKGRVVCEPIPGVVGKLKCRGQVITSTKKAAYEIFIKEIGLDPVPHAKADGIMYADGRPVVLVRDMAVRMTGLSREELEGLWENAAPADRAGDVVFSREQVLAFAQGRPSDAFGEPYRVFDRDRFVARLPRPPYSFIDRIVRVQNAEAFKIRPGAVATAEYDLPEDDWYFRENQGRMPYGVLLEVALQPCGWLSAWSGSALTSDADLHFRNLGGSGVQTAMVVPGAGTLTTEVVMTKASRSGDMIIQHFDFRVALGETTVYAGNAFFGFFTKESLGNQAGIQGGENFGIGDLPAMNTTPDPAVLTSGLPQGMIRMVDEITWFSPHGGPHGLGAIRGRKKVNPEDWFFQAHFYQDPVWPGSLGLEALLQLLKVSASERWGSGGPMSFEACALGRPHEWTYRGQVTPGNREVTVDAVVTEVDDERRLLQASGALIVDGLTIYTMKDFAVRCLD